MQLKNDIINIHINDFDGPLELLLHLIKKSQMDIYDIKIEKITNQYVEYLDKMKNLNVEIIGEYFVMASNLMVIKSKLLLPKKEPIDDNDDYEDPRDELVNRLLIYQQYKEASKFLKKMNYSNNLHHSIDAKVPSASQIIEANNNKSMDASILKEAFQSIIIKRHENHTYVHEIHEWQYTVKEQTLWIINKLSNVISIEFEQLFESNSNLEKVVTTFLSALELVKEKQIFFDKVNGKIYIHKIE
ncbi:segregation/condensation protein A [Apilactobacillus apisilvae]|uniref:Segregation and condensation protein A n=1 Tax=Apilactobacillus apisilvae TaxID=2923364 RepID=A0ABY4PIZ4_9LACO|nr:segregation/condensation protein A [Apilactobacillus apisilvae]UQS85426.1 segregation/condensation protein A [Apilactobacillus apisilvae]